VAAARAAASAHRLSRDAVTASSRVPPSSSLPWFDGTLGAIVDELGGACTADAADAADVGRSLFFGFAFGAVEEVLLLFLSEWEEVIEGLRKCSAIQWS
jgi:hypothetical protein